MAKDRDKFRRWQYTPDPSMTQRDTKINTILNCSVAYGSRSKNSLMVRLLVDPI